MTSRDERRNQIESSIQSKLEHYPDIIKEYYYSLRTNSSTTKVTYINKLLQFLAWYQERFHIDVIDLKVVGNIQSREIDEYFAIRALPTAERENIEASTQATQFTAVSNFFSFLKQRRYIEENPMEDLKRPSVPHKNSAVCLSQDEIKSILNQIEMGVGSNKAKGMQKRYKNRDKLLFLIPLTTGMRLSALSEIDMDAIDLEKREISVIEKRNKYRTFELDDKVYEILQAWILDRADIIGSQDIQALFITAREGYPHRISTRSVQKIVAKFSEQIDMKLSPHKLRKSYGTQYFRMSGNDLSATAAALGHNDLKTTTLYVAEDKEKAREVNHKVADYMIN